MQHFIGISEFKLGLQSRNAQIGTKFVLTSVTLTFDLWPWSFAWPSLWSLVITTENCMMIQWQEHCEKGMTDVNALVLHLSRTNPSINIRVRSRNCGCLVTWFCYQLIAKPGNKTAAVLWPDAHNVSFHWPRPGHGSHRKQVLCNETISLVHNQGYLLRPDWRHCRGLVSFGINAALGWQRLIDIF